MSQLKFTITKKALQKAMSTIGGCIEKKSNGIASNNVCMGSVGENTIRFTAMGQDLTMQCDAEAKIEKAGKLCLDGAKLASIAPVLPDGDVSFTGEPNFWANIKAGASKPRIAGVDPATFPEIPSGKSTPIELNNGLLQTLIRRAIFATSDEQSQFALNTVKLEISKGTAKALALDGYRLSMATTAISESDKLDILIPRKTALEILKLEDADLRIGDDKNHIFIEADGLLLISRKSAGKFPAYEQMFQDTTFVASFDVVEMQEAVRRCGMFTSNFNVRCDLSESAALLSAKSFDAGEIEDSVSVVYTGENRAIGFNWSWLMDFLNLAGEGKMEIAFSESPRVPAKLTAENLPDYQYLLGLVDIKVATAQAEKPAESKPKAKAKKAK